MPDHDDERRTTYFPRFRRSEPLRTSGRKLPLGRHSADDTDVDPPVVVASAAPAPTTPAPGSPITDEQDLIPPPAAERDRKPLLLLILLVAATALLAGLLAGRQLWR